MGERVPPMPILPHPIPYQGSKRILASRILSVVRGRQFKRLFEPFAGSGAMSIAAAQAHLSERFVIGDSLGPLIDIWKCILNDPETLVNRYKEIWEGQQPGDHAYFDHIRNLYNQEGHPEHLLYLLARCVKNSPRFNQQGGFNQSADKRRLGMHPSKMKTEILGASALLSKRTIAVHSDFEETLNSASEHDLVYLDPPWQGTTVGPHKRYHQGLDPQRLIDALHSLNDRRVPYLLSYDGKCGEKVYGNPLPDSLRLTLLELDAGRSTQATLNGRQDRTVESLYLSPALGKGIGANQFTPRQPSLWDLDLMPA